MNQLDIAYRMYILESIIPQVMYVVKRFLEKNKKYFLTPSGFGEPSSLEIA